MAKYLKLGKAARTGGSFSDATTEINISGNQVVKVNPKHLRHAHIQTRMQAGHIVEATQAEYDDYVAKSSKIDAAALEVSKKKKLAAAPVVKDATELEDEIDENLALGGETLEDDEANEDLDGEDETDETDEDEDEDEDDAPARTKQSMINDLTASKLVKPEEKKKLSTLSAEQLIKLHDKIILGK